MSGRTEQNDRSTEIAHLQSIFLDIGLLQEELLQIKEGATDDIKRKYEHFFTLLKDILEFANSGAEYLNTLNTIGDEEFYEHYALVTTLIRFLSENMGITLVSEIRNSVNNPVTVKHHNLDYWDYIGQGMFRAKSGATASQLNAFLYGEASFIDAKRIMRTNSTNSLGSEIYKDRGDRNFNKIQVGDIIVFREDIVESPSVIAFEASLKEQFSLEDRTAQIMSSVYSNLKSKYSYLPQKEIDYMFARLIGGFTYDNFEWDSTAGKVLDGYDEKVYFTSILGLTSEDYHYLRYKIRLQNQISAYTKALYIKNNEYSKNSVPKDELKSYSDMKVNYEKGHSVITPLSDVEFIVLWNAQMKQLFGKGDIAHQFITTSAILATDLDKNGILANLWLGGDENREDMAGWLGDATIRGDEGKTSFGKDDYIADLDAENITYIMKTKGLDLLTAMNMYYNEVGINYTRAQKFLEHTSLETVKEKIFKSLDWDKTFVPTPMGGVYLPLIPYNEKDFINRLKKENADAYWFIRSLEAESNVMQNDTTENVTSDGQEVVGNTEPAVGAEVGSFSDVAAVDTVLPERSDDSTGTTYQFPIKDDGRLTSASGMYDYYDAEGEYQNADHTGAIDVGADEGTPVFPIKSGTVIEVTESNSGYGNNVKINHGNGIITRSSHLHEINVSVGDTVLQSTQIGTVGNTGKSTGNHLDFRVEINGIKTDPLEILSLPSNVEPRIEKGYVKIENSKYVNWKLKE